MYWTLIPNIYSIVCDRYGHDVFLTEPDVTIINNDFFGFNHSDNAVFGPRHHEKQYDVVKYALCELCRLYGLDTIDTHWDTWFVYTKNEQFASRWLENTHKINKVALSLSSPLHSRILMNFNEELALSQLASSFNFIPYGTSNTSTNHLSDSFHHSDDLLNMQLAETCIVNGSLSYTDEALKKLTFPQKTLFRYTNMVDKYITQQLPFDNDCSEFLRMFSCENINGVMTRESYSFKDS